MAGRKTKNEFNFEQTVEGKPSLLVRNVSGQIVSIPGIPSTMNDPFLMPWQETVLDGETWRENVNLRSALMKKLVTVEWVEKAYVRKTPPNVDNAPAEILPDLSFDRVHALDIVMQLDAERSLELVAQDVEDPTTNELNVTFMKTRFAKILRLIEWLEPQYQNRSTVLGAVKERLQWIRSL